MLRQWRCFWNIWWLWVKGEVKSELIRRNMFLKERAFVFCVEAINIHSTCGGWLAGDYNRWGCSDSHHNRQNDGWEEKGVKIEKVLRRKSVKSVKSVSVLPRNPIWVCHSTIPHSQPHTSLYQVPGPAGSLPAVAAKIKRVSDPKPSTFGDTVTGQQVYDFIAM